MGFHDLTRFGVNEPDDPDPVAGIEQVGELFFVEFEGEHILYGGYETLSDAVAAAEDAGFAVALTSAQHEDLYGDDRVMEPGEDDIPF